MPETKEVTSPERASVERWEQETLDPVIRKRPERKRRFETVSLDEVNGLYTPADVADVDYERDISFPGEFPYTRGIHPTGYRGKLWTMRQFAGFGTPEETNARFKYLLEHGQTGLSVAYDLPTLMGYDADSPLSEGEVGKCGVAVSSLADMEVLFDGIPLEEVTVSQTINAPGFDSAGDVSGRRGEAGRRLPQDFGHAPERHPQGVHRAEGVDLPDPPGDEARHRHVRVLHAPRAEVQPDLRQRLPHPRGGRDRAAGTRLHPARRHRVRRVGRARRPRR